MGEAKRKREAARKWDVKPDAKLDDKPKSNPSILATVSLAPLTDGYMSMYYVPGEEILTPEEVATVLVGQTERLICHRLPIPMLMVTTLSDGDDKLLAILQRILQPEHWADIEKMRNVPPCFTAIFGHGHDEELMGLH